MCRCTPPQVARYRRRLSGPLRDRIDLIVDVPAVPVSAIADGAPGEPSATVRERVLFDLRYCPLTPGTAVATDDLPDLQTAVKEQLGLRLEPGHAPVAVTVFDRIERPSPN